ncbi:lysozyme [Salmonella enterica]|uniref:Lysozyme n=1 Tax=Salmonella enterica TaxID=28901 RepID=A0A5T8BIB6_SALER|nr:lysozyme [Salmonella enterica]EDU4886669.1 lysozyme [Salmonella enterica subsp. enterica serovar Java]EBM2193315.1 lysozyme [Salmonella enterica]EBN4403322.1 lysozyme [Salmonella enterica]EBU0748127.1 lysozyme [Salmonella enterica]
MSRIPKETGLTGLELIKASEGLSLRMYYNPAGLQTIGYGHLIKPDEKFNREIKVKEAEDLLKKDLKQAEEIIHSVVTVGLNQNQFDALVALIFNIGSGNFRNSTLLKYLNQGDYSKAADQFLVWDKAGGRKLPGLTHRREVERNIFLSP